MDWSGVSALLSVSPYYNRPSQKGIVQHYLAIADACPVPVIMYNVPKRTGVNMTPQTTLELAQHKNIAGIKEASGDMAQIIDIMAGKPEDFLMISGDDMCTVPMIGVGAVGVISVLANGKPKEMSDMVRYALDGDFESASEILYQLSKINPLMYEESSPVGIKQLLTELGICENHVRLPLVAASESLAEKIRSRLK
jgi:4-hydroxy-tetrahydrodipicolinate synthase